MLRVALAWLGLIYIEMTRIRIPIVRIISRDTTRLHQGFALQKHRIFAAPKNVRQDVATAMIHRVPEPPRGLFLAHVGPLLIDFRFLNALAQYVTS